MKKYFFDDWQYLRYFLQSLKFFKRYFATFFATLYPFAIFTPSLFFKGFTISLGGGGSKYPPLKPLNPQNSKKQKSLLHFLNQKFTYRIDCHLFIQFQISLLSSHNRSYQYRPGLL